MPLYYIASSSSISKSTSFYNVFLLKVTILPLEHNIKIDI